MLLHTNEIRGTWRKILTLGWVAALSASVLVGSALPASAQAVSLRAELTLVAGEDPSVPGVTPDLLANGVARWDGAQIRVALEFLDAARFPEGCGAQVTAGTLSTTVPLAVVVADEAHPVPPGVTMTEVDVRAAGTAAAGQKAQVRIRCEFVNAAGQRERHETQWAGILAAN